jgi:hypothetical protein
MKLYFLTLAILAYLKQIVSVTDFDKDEKASCMAIKPKNPTDCYSTIFNSLVCCHFQMKTPAQGNICVPMPSSANNGSGNVTTILPVNITLTGFYTCKGEMLAGLGLGLFIILAMMF